MDPAIWSELPEDLIIHILSLCEGLDIDLRLKYKIAPHRLPKSDLDIKFSRTWRYDKSTGEYHIPIRIRKFEMTYILTPTSRIFTMLGQDVSIFDLDRQMIL
jgi:hypothetical protein